MDQTCVLQRRVRHSAQAALSSVPSVSRVLSLGPLTSWHLAGAVPLPGGPSPGGGTLR